MKSQHLIAILLVAMSLCNGENKFKKWKNKISTLSKMKWKMPNKNTHLKNSEIPKYPGSNSETKMKIKQLWENYYRCLEEDFERVNNNFISTDIFTPMILEGDSLRMECKACLSPAESEVRTITWRLLQSFESPYTSPEINYHNLEGRIFQDPYDGSLIILRAKGGKDGDGGIYACFHSGSIKSVHYLHVGGEDEPLVGVKPLTAPKGPHSRGIERDGALIASTEWGNWSPCAGSQHITGKCKRVGQRKRFGACKITYSDNIHNNAAEKSNINSNNSQEKEKPVTEDQGSAALHPKNYLKLFGDKGLPCGSLLLSNYVHTNLTLRPNEIESGFCKIRCPDLGNGTRGTEKTEILYDKIEDIPLLKSEVKRITLYEIAGANITLSCPSLQVEEPLAYWQIDDIKVNAENIHNKTKGRIFIDMRNRLHINSLHHKDRNIYSCWRNEHLVATMKLRVRDRSHYSFNQSLAIVIMVLIFASLVYVFLRVFIRTTKEANQKNGKYTLLD